MLGGGEVYIFIASYVSNGLRIHQLLKSSTHFTHATADHTLGIYRNNVASIVSIVDLTS